MLKEESCDGGNDGGNNWARVCDTCHSTACTVYYREESAYLCAGCDARVHAANRVASRHERLWVCQACERAPAAFLCKADAASLCTTCDADIHSANPLARRHQRVPILPISGCLYGPSAADPGGQKMVAAAETEDGFIVTELDETIVEEDEDEAASWLLLNPGKSSTNQNTGILFDGEVDEYLDVVEYNSNVENQFTDQYNQLQQRYGVPHKSYGGVSVVPILSTGTENYLQQKQHQNFQIGLDYDYSKAAYSYNGSISHSVSVSSVDGGVVPESNISDIPTSHVWPSKGTIDLFSGPPIQMPSQLTPMDREARVLRYREKKKTRKFEKTIRYASRKAYAETRPRIKGRFAKRTDSGVEVEQMFFTTPMTETGCGIVPPF
ncbi:Zinc finger protein CONSTANS-LIKE 2 [Hibiscus syriacus]|uniref:Zinc finger protein CONSTANS-LIKE 2 n=1 Tax=Hibiscus syriacus TaxID=106335 RepID=A0A6A3CQK1_HIBSY|nr:zinc finger protein CONSTANS-LIKE 2-like [Hibiscus syriacus]KAE8731216.1 Zinc finger protein CONSTANS-LIKE 2 [Hibiscus syriacus]